MKILTTPLVCLLLTITSTGGYAAGAYTWTDADGTTHYSESPPADDSASTSRYKLTPAPALPGLPPQRIDAINAQADAIAAERIKRETQREKARRLEQKQATGQAPVDLEPQYWYPDPVIVYPPWAYRHYPYRHYGPYRPQPRYRHPPQYHPPGLQRSTPGKTITQQHNAEALRRGHRHW